VTVHSLSPAAKRDIKRLEAVQKLLGKVAFLLGQCGAINVMESIAEADQKIETRKRAIRDVG